MRLRLYKNIKSNLLFISHQMNHYFSKQSEIIFLFQPLQVLISKIIQPVFYLNLMYSVGILSFSILHNIIFLCLNHNNAIIIGYIRVNSSHCIQIKYNCKVENFFFFVLTFFTKLDIILNIKKKKGGLTRVGKYKIKPCRSKKKCKFFTQRSSKKNPCNFQNHTSMGKWRVGAESVTGI